MPNPNPATLTREHAWLNNAATEANCDLNEVAGAIMQLKASVEQLCGDLKAIQQDYTNEKELAEKLEKALLKFGHHLPGCNAADANHICGCGWNAAQEIAALRETK